MRTLYLECQSGISGDMTVAALLDLGADEAVLRKGLESLKVEGYSISVSRVSKSGIDACDFDVRLESNSRNSHTHEEFAHDDHSHSDHSHDSHTHNHSHDAHVHHHDTEHHHRGLVEITGLIQASDISEAAKALAVKIFAIVARAEGKVHGKPVDQVHFHEVGAVDSIVDIVGAAICLDNLGIERVVCTPLREGTGTVRCQHGVIPVPAPATLEILQVHDIPVTTTGIQAELVTPTGAAIVAAVADSFDPPAEMRVFKTGYGAGKRNYPETSGLLRASLIEETAGGLTDRVVLLECNLDDMTGEQLAYACELLLDAGALDVWCTPILMKKGRPAQMLSLLLPLHLETALTELLFLHTSTIGVRRSEHTRQLMQRELSRVSTPLGDVAIKESRRGKICKTAVEYESAKLLASSQNIPINQIYRLAYSRLEK